MRRESPRSVDGLRAEDRMVTTCGDLTRRKLSSGLVAGLLAAWFLALACLAC